VHVSTVHVARCTLHVNTVHVRTVHIAGSTVRVARCTSHVRTLHVARGTWNVIVASAHFETTLPPLITKLTCVITPMSASGSPGTATRSAILPGSTLPSSFSMPMSRAPVIVAD
jgi:hypothetical protein